MPPAKARSPARSASPGGAKPKKKAQTAKKKKKSVEAVDPDVALAAGGDTEAAWRLVDQQAQRDLQTAKLGGEGADEAAKRYERWASTRGAELKQKAEHALADLHRAF